MYTVNQAKQEMPTLEDKFAEVNRPPSRILTADGVELYRVSAENRIPLKFSQIPEHVRNAIIAAEDKRFYSHSGVDEQGLLRAFTSVFQSGHFSQGGSTITMQLAKRLYNGSERSFRRKMDDIAYAYEIESYLGNKNRILELYMNQVYFGEGAHGIGAAAKVYLNKPVEKLTISDAALLSRCVRLPSRENPIKDIDIAMRNRDVVLRIMRDEGMISESEYEDALAEKPKINKRPPLTTAFYSAGYGQYVVQHVLDEVEEQHPTLDLKSGGYTVYCTIDSKLQKLAEKSVRDRVKEYAVHKVNQGMCVVVDSEGKILCEAGGVDFNKNEFNIVTKGAMQPGSGFKPFLYATALRDGVIGPDEYISNAPITIQPPGQKPWSPQNASWKENAPGYRLPTALALSVNRPAVHTILKVRPQTVAQAAYDVFGFRTKLAPYPPLALGSTAVNPLELIEGYSVFMLHGDRIRPYVISRIVGKDGEIIDPGHAMKFGSVLNPQVCETMDHLLRLVVEEGTGKPARAIPNSRGKTGTTNSAKDAWFTGYADGVLCSAWVGNQRKVNGRWQEFPMASNVFGGTTAINIWCDVMRVAQARFGKKMNYEPAQPPVEAPVKKTPEKPADEIKPDVTTPDPPVDEPPVDPGTQPGTDPATSPTDPGKGQTVPPTDTLGGDPATVPPIGNEDVDNTKPKTRRQKPPKGGDEGQTVTVEVCADSGLIASAYCPETVTRTFSKNSAPKRKCSIHRPGG